MRAGVIVAGGYSRRFGERDKALAAIGGMPMIRRVASNIEDTVDHLVVNCRRDQRASIDGALTNHALERRYALDETEDRGPVAGIATGLRAVHPDTTAAFVVACDMPFVSATFVDSLFDRITTDPSVDAVVPRSEDGWYQVLHAVYRPAPMIDACEQLLAAGGTKPLDVVENLDIDIVDVPSDDAAARSFANVNTVEELRAINADGEAT